MKKMLIAPIVTALLLGCASMVLAGPQTYTTSERAIEATSGSVVLPQGPNSTLVLTACPGCTPRTLLATEKTLYFMKRQPVTLAALRAALSGKPDVYVGVFQSVRTGELTRVVASLDAPPAPRAGGRQ
jgi:hypothetical protein